MKVQIYGTPSCGYCTKAKQLCEQSNVDYDYKTVGADITVNELQEMVGQPVRTVPQIFITQNGFSEYVGGYDQLQQKLSGMGV